MSVRVKLVTRDSELKVDENPLYVPSELKRYGLSEVVNQLLQTTEPIPLDFLIDGKLLRGSLENYLISEGLSSESVITVEYVRAVLPPTFMAAFEHEDWVSSVHIQRKGANKIATGSYDGIVRVWDNSGSIEKQLAGHQGAVTAVQWVNDTQLVSASRDRNLHLWNAGDSKKELNCVLKGHTAPVNTLTVLKNDKIVSGSQDSTLKLWSARTKDLPEPPAPAPSKFQSSQKRRRVADAALKSAKVKGSFMTLEGHASPVTGVAPHPVEPDVVYSVSEDHTVRTWDLVTSQLVDTKSTAFSLLSIISLGPQTQLLACGSSARHITLVDPRSATHASLKQLNGHHNFVVSLAPSPQSPYQFASASHDGSVCIWDVRADRNMFTIERQGSPPPEHRDLYCVDWANVLASGGRDKRLELTSVPSGA